MYLLDTDVLSNLMKRSPSVPLLAKVAAVPPERAAPNESLDAVVPVQAPAGSLIVWHGHTWHGPLPRTVPGLRISVLFYFCREYVAAQERYGNEVPPELLARNPARFRVV